MFSFNRETMTMVAVVVALAAVFYMYQDSEKMKKDITECKNVSVGLVKSLASVQAPAREVNAGSEPHPPSTEEESED